MMQAGASWQTEGRRKVVRRARWSVICFIAASILFIAWMPRLSADPSRAIRAGMLADLVTEMPQGRQALVSSLHVLPFPTLLALPFAAFTRTHALALACLYAVAAAGAMAVSALASLLGRLRLKGAEPFAAVCMLAAAAAAAHFGWDDIFIAGAMLLIAVALECHPNRVVRALSGTFYGLAMLSHPFGAAAALVRLVLLLVVRVLRYRDRELAAVTWVCACQLVYVGLFYFFLCWIVMGHPFVACRKLVLPRTAMAAPPKMAPLTELISADFEGCAPVVSGLWGYLAGEPLGVHSGYRFLDFHPDKLPAWEERDIVLVVPSGNNPLAALSDLAVACPEGTFLEGALLLRETPDWQLWLVRRSGG